MGPARKGDDESVQTSLRELMRQEEERVRGENDRLEQLRAAKARIDRERAEAAREAEEARARRQREEHADLEAKKAAAALRARIEAQARAEEQRIRLALLATMPTPPKARGSRFVVGMTCGIVAACLGALGCWSALVAPRIESERATSARLRVALEEQKQRERQARAANQAALDDLKSVLDASRADNDRLRVACVATTQAPKHPPPRQRRPATQTTCVDPHDPLCADLDAR